MRTAQSPEITWDDVWNEIDIIFSRFVAQMSAKIDDLYIEKGNFATRDCPINAYLALANPMHGDIAQMEATDLVSISVDFCNENSGICVTTTASKGTMIFRLQQGPISLDKSQQEIKGDIRNILVKVDELISQSFERVHEMLM